MVELTLLDAETVGPAAGSGDVVYVRPRGTHRHIAHVLPTLLWVGDPSVLPAPTLITRVLRG